MKNKKRTKLFLFMLVTLLGCFPIGSAFRAARRRHLNQELIRSIKVHNLPKALALFHEGADGTARDVEIQSGTMQDFWKRSIDRLPFGISPPLSNGTDPTHQSALLLLYTEANSKLYPDQTLALSLPDHGAPIQDHDQDGDDILSFAVWYHQHAVVQRLLERGANVNSASPAGQTPVMSADLVETRMLLAHGASVAVKDNEGNTSLFDASGEKAELLLQHGAKMEDRNAYGDTPLLLDCIHGNDSGVLTLLKHGANIHVKDKNGNTG